MLAVIILLIAVSSQVVRGLIQRAKVSASKATLNGFALCVGMIKDDTGLYPENLSDTKEADPPEGFSFRDWCGPYAPTLSLKDPWGNLYFYQLQDTIFGPQDFERTTGNPYEGTFTFTASPSPPKGTLIIENPGVTSGSVTLNGEEVVEEDEFKKITPVIIKEVNLLATNTITIKLRSTPGLTIKVSITTSQTSKDATFTLGSYGRDGQFGGTKYDADIVYGKF